jgi:nitrilase
MKQQNNLRIAAIQMASGPSVGANLIEAKRLIDQAAQQGAQMVLLPEYFALMGLQEEDKLAVAEEIGHGQIQRFLSQRAARHGIWLIGGSVPIRCAEAGRVKNSCLVYNEVGSLVGRYDKIHLFGLHTDVEQYLESKTTSPGNTVTVLDSPWGRIGLSICYDLRFPELYRAMQPVDIILVPAAFTENTGRAHWETLVRARAIENLAYVVAAAQGGYHLNGRETHGDSMIVSPWGEVMDRLPRGSGFVIATLDHTYQQKMRQQLPALQHKVL